MLRPQVELKRCRSEALSTYDVATSADIDDLQGATGQHISGVVDGLGGGTYGQVDLVLVQGERRRRAVCTGGLLVAAEPA